MDIFPILLTIIGLTIFEVVGSIDNAIINTNVLVTMPKKSRKFFLIFGLFFAVFVVRGALPWLIVWFATPSLGPIGALTATFSSNPAIEKTIEQSSKLLLAGGGTFLLLLFLNWFTTEEKNYALSIEKYVKTTKQNFIIIALLIISILASFSFKNQTSLGLSTLIGAVIFFFTMAIKKAAEKSHKKIKNQNISVLGKLLYLEVIDASFSVDSVLGAFAFTFSVPLILIGNGIGALVVRQLTIKNLGRIHKYTYLSNGAMYSIFILGIIMILKSFSFVIPSEISPIASIATIIYFMFKSKKPKVSIT